MSKKPWTYLAVVGCVLAFACNTGKAPAEAALKAAEEAVNGARAEAENLVPDDFKSLSDDLAAAKDAYAKGDYKGALAGAQSVQSKANDVLAKARARKQEMTTSWNALADSVPKMIEAAKSRVDILSQSKKLPKGLDAMHFASAKDSLAAAQSSWTAAEEAWKAGKGADAIAQANTAKDKATAALSALGMPAGGAAAATPAPAK